MRADRRLGGLEPWVLATLVGLAIGFRWLVGIGGSSYSDPSAFVDVLSVAGWSLALAAIGAGVVLLVEIAGRSRSVARVGVVTVAGALVASLANLVEDLFDVPALGPVYVAAVLVLAGALLGLAFALRLSGGSWRLWVLALATFVGVFTVEIGGLILASGAWLAFGWALRRDPASISAAGS